MSASCLQQADSDPAGQQQRVQDSKEKKTQRSIRLMDLKKKDLQTLKNHCIVVFSEN